MARHQKRGIAELFKAFDNEAIGQKGLWSFMSFYIYSAIVSKEPLKNTITMLKQSFLSATLLDLLDLSYLIGLRRSASRQTKITDFIKRDGVFQRFHKSNC